MITENKKQLTEDEIFLIIAALNKYNENTDRMIENDEITMEEGVKFINMTNNIIEKISGLL